MLGVANINNIFILLSFMKIDNMHYVMLAKVLHPVLPSSLLLNFESFIQFKDFI